MRERRADLADLTVLADLDDLIVLAHLADGVDVVAVLDAGGELDARCDEISVLARVGERLLNLDREHLAVNGHSLGRIARAAAVHLDTQGHSLVHRAMVGGLQPGHIGLQGCRAAGLQGCSTSGSSHVELVAADAPEERLEVDRRPCALVRTGLELQEDLALVRPVSALQQQIVHLPHGGGARTRTCRL